MSDRSDRESIPKTVGREGKIAVRKEASHRDLWHKKKTQVKQSEPR